MISLGSMKKNSINPQISLKIKKFIFLKNELSIPKNLGYATPLDQDQDNYLKYISSWFSSYYILPL